MKLQSGDLNEHRTQMLRIAVELRSVQLVHALPFKLRNRKTSHALHALRSILFVPLHHMYLIRYPLRSRIILYLSIKEL